MAFSMSTSSTRAALLFLLFTEACWLGAHGWSSADATYYGGTDESGTNNGACGYQNLYSEGYGSFTTALSDALFQGGVTCGACYEVQCTGINCVGSSVTVTATNECPQGSYGGWCDGSNAHFDMSYSAFQQIGVVGAGHVTVQYQKVSCSRSGGIHFEIDGHTYFFQVLVYNVGGAGDVDAVSVNGISLSRSWGQLWQTGTVLDGQALSISVTTSDGSTCTSYNVASSNWQYGQTFVGSQF